MLTRSMSSGTARTTTYSLTHVSLPQGTSPQKRARVLSVSGFVGFFPSHLGRLQSLLLPCPHSPVLVTRPHFGLLVRTALTGPAVNMGHTRPCAGVALVLPTLALRVRFAGTFRSGPPPPCGVSKLSLVLNLLQY